MSMYKNALDFLENEADYSHSRIDLVFVGWPIGKGRGWHAKFSSKEDVLDWPFDGETKTVLSFGDTADEVIEKLAKDVHSKHYPRRTVMPWKEIE